MTAERLPCRQCGHHNRTTARYCGGCGVLLPGLAAQPAAPLRPGEVPGVGDRYRITRELGRGGFGEVYLAEDRRLGRLCVIKRLRVNPMWEPKVAQQLRASFTREARLLASLNSPGHPNIPEIFDHLDAQLCLVMKYVEGESLADLLVRRGMPLPEAEALRYVRDVCAALVYMHGRPEPALHRDLKPANIMLDIAGKVWLIDFGLARLAPIELQGGDPEQSLTMGTRGYTPPEQWAGSAEARSDVYALAATLYELLTRRRPLRAPGAELEPVRALNPAVRPEVEDLIGRGMARELAARPSAASFLAELEALLSLQDLPLPEPEHAPTVAALVGREAALDDLERRLHAARYVALIGMPGVGKTALAAALAGRHAEPARVFWHTFRAGEGADTLIWRLAGWLAHGGRPAVWQQLRGAQQSGGPPITPDLLVDYLIQQMRGWNGLLCFDDAHVVAGDEVTVGLVSRLAYLATAGGPPVIVTARTLPAQLRARETVTLGGLDAAAAHRLLAQAGLSLEDDLLASLYGKTEGNPQFLTLAIATLRQVVDPAALVARLSEASDLGGYLLSEVDAGLTTAERRAMEAVAVLQGYGGTQEAITAILGGAAAYRTLARLGERHLLAVEVRAAGPVYRQHAMVQSFYYDTMQRRRQRTLHERAANYFEAEARDLLSAGRHFARAGQPARAAEALTRDVWGLINQGQGQAALALLAELPLARLEPGLRAAARTAQGEILAILGEHEAARVQLEQAIADGVGLDQAVQQARRHRLLAQVCERTGAYEEAEASCQRGLALARGPGAVRTETARLYSQLAEVLMRRSDFAAAENACQAGLAALPPAPANPGERGALLLRQATIEGRRGSYAQAITALEESLALARKAGDPMLSAAVLHNLGRYHQLCGRSEQALACFTESLHHAEQVGDLARRISTINGIGLIQLELNDRAAAMRHFEECRTLSLRFNMPESQAFALLNIGCLLYEQSYLDEAEKALTMARTIFGRLGIPDEEAHCLYLLGDVALRRGDAVRAAMLGRQALALASEVGSRVFESCALRVLGEAQLAQGLAAEAAGALAQAQALQEAIGDPYDQALIRVALARLALAQGEYARARAEAAAVLPIIRAHSLAYLEQVLTALIAEARAA